MKSLALGEKKHYQLPDLAGFFSYKHKMSFFYNFMNSKIAPSILVVLLSSIPLLISNKPTTVSSPFKPAPIGNKFSFLSVKSSETKKAETKPVPPKAATPPCAPNVINLTTPWLEQCPNLYMSFSSLKDGPINTKIFNIYNGPPEGNQEAQLYTNNQRNIAIENGTLTLRALDNPSNNFRYTSARIDTKDKKDFFYGRLEIEATLPNNIGAWPAIWMLATNRKYIGMSSSSDPLRYLNDGEIDIAESVGAEPNVVYGIAHSLAHPPGESNDYFNVAVVPNNDIQFHKYGIDWTPNKLSFTLDGVEYFAIDKQPGADYKSWPYDQPFYLIINLAVGGAWGGILRSQYPPDGVNTSQLPFVMKVRTISYYRMKS